MSWLLHSMKPVISCHYLRPKTAKQIEDPVAKTYYEMDNTTKVYELKQSIFQLQQGDLPLAAYYSSLKEMWEEMDHCLCKEDITAYARHVEEFRIYELLVSLNAKYEQLRVNILGKVPLPSMNEVYAYLDREEQRRCTMSQPSQVERSVMFSSSQRGGCGGIG